MLKIICLLAVCNFAVNANAATVQATPVDISALLGAQTSSDFLKTINSGVAESISGNAAKKIQEINEALIVQQRNWVGDVLKNFTNWAADNTDILLLATGVVIAISKRSDSIVKILNQTPAGPLLGKISQFFNNLTPPPAAGQIQ